MFRLTKTTIPQYYYQYQNQNHKHLSSSSTYGILSKVSLNLGLVFLLTFHPRSSIVPTVYSFSPVATTATRGIGSTISRSSSSHSRSFFTTKSTTTTTTTTTTSCNNSNNNNNMIPTTISFHDEITWKENDNVSTTTTTTSSTTTTTVLIGTTTVLQDFISNENTELNMKELQLLEQKSILMAMLESITPTGTTTGTSTSTSTSTSSSSGCTSSFVVVDGGGSGNGANNSKNGSHQKLVLMCLPDHVTRNNHPWSVHTITEHLSKNIPPTKTKTTSRIIFCGSNVLDHVGALVTAVAKAFPVYSRKTSTSNDTNHDDNSDDNKSNSNNNSKERTIYLTFCNEKGQVQIPSSDVRVTALAAVEGIQLAARLVDMPPAELTTDVYAEICHEYAETLPGVTMKEIVAEELQQQGYGGIYGVGKAATCPPRLIIMEYTPPPEVAAKNNNNNNNNNNSDDDNNTHIALVGKAIVYDTGGLSLKPKVGMCGMKADMGGSAGLLGGFVATVKSGEYPYKLTLLLCMAENAIGPTAFRNDDILTLYSGYVQ